MWKKGTGMKGKVFSKVLAVTLAFVMVFAGTGLGQWTVQEANAETVIEVSTQADLAGMEQTAGTYKLVADITLENWSAIYPASGFTLDGNGHTITLTGAPLFAYVSENDTVKNLTVTGTVTETERKNTGAIAQSCSGTIRNCAASVSVTYSGTSPNIYLGGIVGKTSGTVTNCLTTGTVTNTGNTKCYGAVANTALFETAAISNCVAVGGDRIGSAEGFGAPTIISGTNCTLISDVSKYNPEDYVEFFNANLQEGDLSWSVEDGILAPRGGNGGTATPEEDASEEEIAALDAAISSAKAVDAQKLYTADTWSSFSNALEKAENVKAGTSPLKQTAVVNAAAALTQAQNGLAEKPTAAVSLDGQDVVSVTTSSQLEYLTSGKYYRLDADITIDDAWWFGTYNVMNAVLDGNGHTITVANKTPLWKSIGSEAVIQNLGIIGDAVSTDSFGVLAADCQGLIVNCWSQASIGAEGQNGGAKDAGNFVAYLKSGGAIVNSYTAGSVTAKGTTGALAAASEKNTLVKNCYWLDTIGSSAVGSASGNVKESSAKERAAFYSTELIALLNSQKGENGKAWAVSSTGYPYFGENFNYVPEGDKELPENQTAITFTPQGGSSSEITNQKLTIDRNEVNTMKVAGVFQLPDYVVPEGASVKWSCSAQNPEGTGAINEETGEFFVYQDGSLVVTAVLEQDGGASQTLAAVKVTVMQSQVEAVKLYLANADGTQETEIENDAATVQGSETKKIAVKAKYTGEEEYRAISSDSFNFDVEAKTGKVAHMDNSSIFYFTKPGTAVVTVTYKNDDTVKASAEITSEYVAVESVKPAISGRIVLHGRNANSTGGEDFLPNYSSVIVSPANASYAADYTIKSSDDSTARYVSSMVMGYVPYKAGSVTYTASILDNGTAKSGTAEAEYVYLNPLKRVTAENSKLTVKENQSISAGLVFEGALTDGHEVTETGMNWSFSQDGIIEITRENGAWKRDESAPDNNMYFLSSEYTIHGLKQGTVTVTGTPADQTGGAQSVTFEVTVTQGEAEIPADNDKLIATGINDAKNYLNSQDGDELCSFGNEWYFFTLTRAGVSIDPENVEKYLDSVKSAYSTDLETDKAGKLKPTTLARVILTASVLGEDPENMNGTNLIEMLYGSTRIGDGGNEAIWALLALDCCSYDVPADAEWTRDELVREILEYRSENGGFAWNEKVGNPDIDTTAMAIQALAPYVSLNPQAAEAVEKALEYLQSKMNSNCQFGNSEASSQVLIALTALGKDPAAEENGFVKSAARNLISGLDAYRIEGKGFAHLLNDAAPNGMATDQALRGLEACRRYYSGENTLYDLTDVNVRRTLEKRVAEAGALQEEYYKADLWAAMIQAKDDAEAVLAKEDASHEEMKAADAALASALAALYASNPAPGNPADDIVVYVTIAEQGSFASGKENTVMGDVPVTVSDRNSDGRLDVDEVLYAAHERYYEGGAADGYDCQGTWLTKLWGKDAGSSGLWINDAPGTGLSDAVCDSDYVSVFTYKDTTAWSDTYVKYDKNVYTVNAGDNVDLQLLGAGYDMDWNLIWSPCANAQITLIGENRTLGTTDENGRLAISSLKEGTYKIAVCSDDGLTVPAAATIVVKNPYVPQDQVFLRVADPSGRTYLTKTSYDFTAGETAYSILEKSGLEYKSRYYGIYGGYYVYEIEGLAEFDKGAQSGWMYRVNGIYPEISCSEYKLQAGDYVEWLYTSDLGYDIGAAVPSETQVSTTGAYGSAVTTAPLAVTVSGTGATAALTEANAEGLLKQAKENKSAEIVLTVSTADVKDADSLKVQLDSSLLKDIYNSTSAKLTVKTPFGEKTYSREELKALSAEAAGSIVTVDFAKNTEADADDVEKIAAGVQTTKLTARSEKTSKGIKIIWTKSKGYKVDYYEVFRSTKRYSGYGKAAFYTTKNAENPDKTWYVNTKDLKAGTRYYYKVRGVRVLDGKKYYTQWSTKAWRIA